MPARMERTIVIDSIPIRRSHSFAPGQTTSFYGNLAIALNLHSVPDFAADYERIIDGLFGELHLDRRRKIYNAHEITRELFGRPRILDAFLFRFGRHVLELPDLKVTAFIGSFDPASLAQLDTSVQIDVTADPSTRPLQRAQVHIYGRSPGRTYVSLWKFLGLVQNPFPALAAWKYCERTGARGQSFLLDYFEGQMSQAWDELIGANQVHLVPDGDSCSPYISAADLLLRSVDRQLARRANEEPGHQLERGSVWAALAQIGGWDPAAEVHAHTISNREIPMIAPYTDSAILSEAFIQHPILLVVNEATHSKERDEIENSPLMRQIYDRAYDLGGSVMFYRPERSPSLIRDGDWIIHYGVRGAETLRRLRRLGFRLNEWRAGEEQPETRPAPP